MSQFRRAARETRNALGLNVPTAAAVVLAAAVVALIQGHLANPETGSVSGFALWLVETLGWLLAVAAVFLPHFVWNLFRVRRWQRSIDASRQLAMEHAVSVDGQVKLFISKSLAETRYGVAACYAFGSVVREYPTRDVDIVIGFNSSDQRQIRTYRNRIRELELTFSEVFQLTLHLQTFLDSECDQLLEFLAKAGDHEQWI